MQESDVPNNISNFKYDKNNSCGRKLPMTVTDTLPVTPI